MPRTGRVVLFLVAASVVTGVPLRSAIAQLAGSSTGAAIFSPVDASALGASRLSSVGLSLTDGEFVVGGGLGMAGGSLRGYAGGGNFAWSTGVGYSSTFVRRSVANGLLYGTIGGQLTGGYRHWSYTSDAGALNMTIPIGISLGDPDGKSLMVYAAPYAELGLDKSRVRYCSYNGTCTEPAWARRAMEGAGVGLGVRVSAGRFAIGAYTRDFGGRRHLLPNMTIVALGLSFQLGKASN